MTQKKIQQRTKKMVAIARAGWSGTNCRFDVVAQKNFSNDKQDGRQGWVLGSPLDSFSC